ncbi:uncharacterized protein LOC110627330 [Manihot esculenta]|uniref:Uncharacterized protein n=1 Tax=Manihot esculenta TaxID=3983 RepID=A0A2C9WL13_MANES|nr:uncharacterized protein LOC110627330 [Manihot esculenta]OAY60773.1 hypothetical protein MANES_01G137700v8 [Manihot esculenta]
MLRAFSTRRSSHRGGYERLLSDESAVAAPDDLEVGTLKRSKTLPAPPPPSLRSSSTAKKFLSQLGFPNDSQSHHNSVKSCARNKANKSHPLLSLFDARRKRKTTAKPEFTRYLEYLREGGVWDVSSNMPVIYYK